MAFRINGLFDNYLRHNEINDYLDFLAEKYPDTVTVKTCGNSFEGRPLKSIRISRTTTRNTQQVSHPKTKETSKTRRSASKSSTSKVKLNKSPLKENTQIESISSSTTTKPVVLIDGGIHAREWISVATAIYCIYQLTEKGSRNEDVLSRLDFVIVPVVNVDGYEYTHTHSRFWRKTRKPILGGKYIGTDCNRNFDFHWSSACNRASRYTFRGVTPFSEPETVILQSIMHSLKDNCKFYLTLHAYAQAFMYPWGFTKSLPTNWSNLHRLAKVGHCAIRKKTGKFYRCGSVAALIKHTAAGGSPDYALGAVKIPYAMTMELSGGGYGFDPPKSEIRGLVSESWAGIHAMCVHIAEVP